MSFEESYTIKSDIISNLSECLYCPVIDNSKETVLKREQLLLQMKKENLIYHS